MGFPWDGDEVRFPKDLSYFQEYGRLLKEALPADTPVHFVMRADVSWDMEQEFKVLEGVVRLWCCGGGIAEFLPRRAQDAARPRRHCLVLRRSAHRHARTPRPSPNSPCARGCGA